MALRGIDISSYQAGIDFGKVPCDFVIVKATEGTGYVNPAYEAQYSSAKNHGKKLGIYHYAAGGNAEAEARHFLKCVGTRYKEAVLCLDWEAGSNPAYGNGQNISWVDAWMNTVETATGKKPLLYCSPYLIGYYSKYKNSIWAAQYASNNPVYGYQDHPWNEGAYSCVIRQYSGCGRLTGFNGNLDLDKFYGDGAAWDKLIDNPTPTIKTDAKPNAKPNAVYRLYYAKGFDHLFTTSKVERDQLIKSGWKYEGIAWYADPSGIPVYRAYNAGNGDHLLTTSKSEYENVVKSGWKGEGTPFKAKKNGKPVYRLYNQGTKSHFYTVSDNEKSALVKNGWKSEGCNFYA